MQVFFFFRCLFAVLESAELNSMVPGQRGIKLKAFQGRAESSVALSS